MGAYLSEPIVEKESTDEKSTRLSYGASSMQGWRAFQEDAHNCIIDFDTDTSLFAVYDGHGGAEVAKYCSLNLPDYLRSVNEYKKGNLSQGLEETFLEFDSTLVKPEVVADLKRFADLPADDESEDDTFMLKEEAQMPLDALLARYTGSTGEEGGDVGAKNEKIKDESTTAPLDVVNKVAPHVMKYHNEKPKSPKLHAKKSKLANDSSEALLDTTTTTSATTTTKIETESSNGVSKKSAAAEENSLNGVSSSKESPLAAQKVEKNEVKDNVQASTEICTAVDSSDGFSKSSAKSTTPKSSSAKDLEDDGVSSTTINGEGSKGSKEEDDTQPGCSNVTSSSSASSSTPKSEKKKRAELTTVARPTVDDDEDGESSTGSEEDEDFKGPESESTDAEEEDDDDDSEGEEEESSSSDEESSGMMIPQGDEPGQDSGCTAVVAVVRGNHLTVANAGDSRCVVCRNGEAVEMSFDHKPEDDIERERIKKAGGEVTSDGRVNGGLNLSRAIGDHSYKTNESLSAKEQMITALPDIKQLTLDTENDQFMVLACDGIWNSMSSQEVVDFVKVRISKEEKMSKICEELFDLCMAPDTTGDGTGCDNMTAIIVKFHNLTPAMEADSNKRTAQNEEGQETQQTKKPKLDC